MKIARPVSGRILSHAEGLGVPSADTVRQRARELAQIDGRSSASELDWKRAFLELHGGHDSASREEENEMLGAMTDMNAPAPTLGRLVRQADIDGGDNLGEELISEGLAEADHDRMLEARRVERGEE